MNPDLPEAHLYIALGKALRSLRDRSGLTQVEAGKRANIRATFISQIENGSRGMRFHTLIALLDSYNADLADLATGYKKATGEL